VRLFLGRFLPFFTFIFQVVASGTALGIVIYSGRECRATMNNSAPREEEIGHFGRMGKKCNSILEREKKAERVRDRDIKKDKKKDRKK
jgi:hypothetical protein